MTKTKVSLQEQIKQLDELVRYFENGSQGFDLESGIQKYEEAMQIVQTVKGELEGYELKIKEIEAKYAAEDTPSQDELSF
jgi:exodeoxyribonuclease VII small subunit